MHTRHIDLETFEDEWHTGMYRVSLYLFVPPDLPVERLESWLEYHGLAFDEDEMEVLRELHTQDVILGEWRKDWKSAASFLKRDALKLEFLNLSFPTSQ